MLSKFYSRSSFVANMADFANDVDDDLVNPNTSMAAGLFCETISCLRRDAKNVDTAKLFDVTKSYCERVIGPRRTSETPDRYKARVFADLIELCESGGRRTVSDRRDEMLVYARHATESGDVKSARKWYLRLIAEPELNESDPKSKFSNHVSIHLLES